MMNTNPLRIRNFCIIAHIDHGKSTLADRLLEATGALSSRDARSQFLDNLDIEQERGITIKAQTVSLNYQAADGQEYLLNLIDTPGHVDFAYEVSHAIKACEAALLVVDASQGVEAQTLATVYLAVENELEILPVINKIDLPAAEPERVKQEIEELIGLDTSQTVLVSAKSGQGVAELLEKIIKIAPPPQAQPDLPLAALVIDTWFDSYLGIVVLFRVFDGTVQLNDRIRFMASGREGVVNHLGKHTPHKTDCHKIAAGETGYLGASIKNLADVRVGDTITLVKQPTAKPLPGYAEAKPMVFSGIYPLDSGEFSELKESMLKLCLNDASIQFEVESSSALGFGLRCGFLGLLHLEIVRERLEKEYGMNIILTNPAVSYKVITAKDEEIYVDNPVKLPPPQMLKEIHEPFVLGTIFTPSEYIGPIIELAMARRAKQRSIEYITANKVVIKFELPLSEIVVDFYDQLKTISGGYASFDYDPLDYRPGQLVKLDLLINGTVVDALSTIVHRTNAYNQGRLLTAKLKELIPRQMFEVQLQAALGSKIIARETISALRKNVTAKCYGGDITRKRKLLEKQKEGKKRMKQLGAVDVPKEAFLTILSNRD